MRAIQRILVAVALMVLSLGAAEVPAVVQKPASAVHLNKNEIDQSDRENNGCFKCETIQ